MRGWVRSTSMRMHWRSIADSVMDRQKEKTVNKQHLRNLKIVCPHSSSSDVKFDDDTVSIGLIPSNDQAAYLGDMEIHTAWC
ncbi:uncharacterized [Tachysurus ichikawai]